MRAASLRDVWRRYHAWACRVCATLAGDTTMFHGCLMPVRVNIELLFVAVRCGSCRNRLLVVRFAQRMSRLVCVYVCMCMPLALPFPCTIASPCGCCASCVFCAERAVCHVCRECCVAHMRVFRLCAYVPETPDRVPCGSEAAGTGVVFAGGSAGLPRPPTFYAMSAHRLCMSLRA